VFVGRSQPSAISGQLSDAKERLTHRTARKRLRTTILHNVNFLCTSIEIEGKRQKPNPVSVV
jgi:hypothetical protein